MKLATLVALGVSWGAVCAAAGPPIPEDARRIIGVVSSAAARQDFASLEQLMVREFTWSFGGDRDARQALEAWRVRPAYLKQLHRVTGGKCEFVTAAIVECPAKAGTGHRAGFERTRDGWRMTYFVAGD